jgi:hypothetical protein
MTTDADVPTLKVCRCAVKTCVQPLCFLSAHCHCELGNIVSNILPRECLHSIGMSGILLDACLSPD